MKKFATAILIASLSFLTAQAQVTGGVADGFVTVTTDADVAMSGLDLKSAGGNFVPIPPGDTTAPAAPFTFLLANSSTNVSYAAIPGTTVNVAAGTLTTGVGYTGDAGAVADDMAASTYGNAAFQQVAFPVMNADTGTDPEPVSQPVTTSTGLSFAVGNAGFVIPGNNWPDGEAPHFAIDGAGQKYLNFGQQNTGFVVRPTSGSTVATELQLWAANDAIERDPAFYEVWGANEGSAFTPISTGALMLPDTRNGGGDAALDDANSFTVEFDNSAAYTSYLVIFPDIKDPASANSMQIADVQLFDAAGTGIFAPGDPILGGQLVPEPSSSLLGLMAMLGILLVRKRRK